MKKIPAIISKNLDALFVVGGAVRDMILGKEPEELDLITTTPLGKISFKTFTESHNNKTVGTYIKGTKYDISWYDSLESDLKRRDFTINSMAVPVNSEGEIDLSKVIDLCGGISDLQNRILRSFRPLENMRSDPVRIVRGLRFTSEYGLTIEKETLEAMKDVCPSIKSISKDRIFAPLNGFVSGKYFSKAIEIAKEIGMERCINMPEQNFDLASKVDPVCRWPAIFFMTDKLEDFSLSVFPPKNFSRKISRICDFGKNFIDGKYDWAVKISNEEAFCLINILKLYGQDPSSIQRRMTLQLNIKPEDLLKIGFKGKQVSAIMIEIWKAILEDKISNDKYHLTDLALKLKDHV